MTFAACTVGWWYKQQIFICLISHPLFLCGVFSVLDSLPVDKTRHPLLYGQVTAVASSISASTAQFCKFGYLTNFYHKIRAVFIWGEKSHTGLSQKLLMKADLCCCQRKTYLFITRELESSSAGPTLRTEGFSQVCLHKLGSSLTFYLQIWTVCMLEQ